MQIATDTRRVGFLDFAISTSLNDANIDFFSFFQCSLILHVVHEERKNTDNTLLLLSTIYTYERLNSGLHFGTCSLSQLKLILSSIIPID